MKLRQKLAVALASAMVITAVPVVTMAASTNTLTKETLKVGKNDVLDITTAQSVKVSFKDNTGAKEVFYLQLTNAKWDAAAATYVDGNVSYEKQSETVVKVTVDAAEFAGEGKESLVFPILAKATGGDATVEVISMGGSTTVSKGSFVFATTSEKEVTAKVTGTVPTFYTDGTLAEISVEESFKGAIGSNGVLTFKIELGNPDYKFVNTNAIEITGAYGFSNQEFTYTVTPDSDNTGITVKVNFGDLSSQDSLGVIKINKVAVDSTVKAPELGDLVVDVRGDQLSSTLADAVVAKITSYGSTVTVAEADKVEIKAGSVKMVKFTLAETEKTSFVDQRDVEFVLNNGFIMPQVEKDGKYNEALTKAAVEAVVKLNNTVESKALTIKDVIVANEVVVGFVATMEAGTSQDKITVEMPVVGAMHQDGDVAVTISGRAMAEEITAVITKINKAFNVTTEAATLKVGLQGQEAGKITLTETDKAMFGSAKEITLEFTTQSGIKVTDVPTVKVTEGDMQVGEVKLDTKTKKDAVIVRIPVKRASKTASTIEIAGLEFTVDRTVAEGAYDLVLGGTALSTTEQTMDLTDFIVIGTPNTEDLASNGLARGTASFVIGEATYTMNGVAKEMEAKSYIQDPGFTMIPVRYVAEAFGVKANDILFSNGTATIFAGTRTIQLTAGSNIAIVNGASVAMETKVVVKDGRTYAPISEIAKILGISKGWDSETKTATFTNK